MVTSSGIVQICCASIVGGNWNNSALAGVRTRNLNNPSSNSNNNVGCRDCISSKQVELQGCGVWLKKRNKSQVLDCSSKMRGSKR